MQKPKETNNIQFNLEQDFEEIDHRLACGWYVEIEGSGQHKRYLRSIKSEQLKPPIPAN